MSVRTCTMYVCIHDLNNSNIFSNNVYFFFQKYPDYKEIRVVYLEPTGFHFIIFHIGSSLILLVFKSPIRYKFITIVFSIQS